MANIETIKIKIDVDADSAKIKKLTRDIERLKRAGGSNSSLSSGKKTKKDVEHVSLADRLKLEKTTYKKHFDYMDKGAKMAGGALRKFLGFAIKGIVVEMALLGAAMLAVHALFIAGKFLSKAYSGAMQLAAQGFAALATAAAVAAAAVREQQAAMYAYRGKGAGEFGAGINQARVAMRALQMDQDLAGLGAANLNKAYAVMSKTMSTPQINASTKMFKNLMDFGSAGQDPAAAAEKVGAVIEAISGGGKNKKSLSQTISLIKQLGPEAAEALKKANVTTKAELTKLINSGEFAKMGGVFGQFSATNNTLIGRMKGFFQLVKGQFADFGQQFLGPAKEAMQRIFQIISREVRKILSVSSSFASGDFMNGLVTIVDKVASFFGNTLQKWLPAAQGQFGKMGDWWKSFMRTLKIFRENLRPLIDGAKVLEEAFKPIFKALFENGKKNMASFRKELLENKDEVLRFGEGVATFINATGDFAIKLKEAFFDILPLINSALEGITDIYKMLTKLLGSGGGGGPMKALAPLLGMFLISGKMKNASGMMMANNKGMAGSLLANQTITAQTVNLVAQRVTGPGVGPVGGPGTAPVGTPGAPIPGVPVTVRPGTPGAPGGPGPLHGPPAYTNAGQPLYGPVGGTGYPGGKLVGRDPVTGRFTKLTPGTGDVGVGGPGYLGRTPTTGGASALSSGSTVGPAVVPGGGPAVAPGGTTPASPVNFAGKAGSPLPQTNNVPGAPQYIQTSTGKIVPNYSGVIPGRGMMAPKIDENGNMSNLVRPTKENIKQLNAEAKNYAIGGTNQPGGKPITEFQRKRMAMRYNRTETVGAQKMAKFNNSATAKMGTTMALGFMASKGPEEMRGAMAMGAGLAAVNPMLGIGVAGVGGALKAKGAGKGALAGAAGGAAFGTMIGGPGMGTAIGAAIGLVGGAIMGGVNEMKARAKEASGAAKDALAGIFKGVMQQSYSTFEKNQAILAEGGDTTGMKGSLEGAGAKYNKKALALAERAKTAQTEERFGFNAIQGNIQKAPGPVGLLGRVMSKSLASNPLTAALGSVLAGDAGLTKETGKNDYKMSMEGIGNSSIDVLNSSVTNPMQMMSSALGAMVPDILNVGALIGKIPGAEKVGSLFNTGIGKGIKSALGFNVKSGRRTQEEDFLKQLQKEGIMTEDQLKAALKSPGDAVNQFVKDSEEKAAAFSQIDDVNAKRLKELEKMTGKTKPELEALAKSMGVDLYDASMKFDDMVTKLRINMVKSAADMKAANQNAFLETSAFTEIIKKDEAKYAVDDKVRILADQFQAGNIQKGDTDVYKFLEGINADILALNGGDALAAYYDQQAMIGTGGRAYTAGGSMEGMESIIAGDEVFKKNNTDIFNKFAQTGAEQVTAMFGQEDMSVVGGSGAIMRQIQGMTDKKMQQKLLTDLESNKLTGQTFDADGKSTGLSLTDSLKSYGINVAGQGIDTTAMDTVADGMLEGSKVFKDAVAEFTSFSKDFFTNTPVAAKPDWFTKESFMALVDDTSTPRGKGIGDTTTSRLSQTMARHAGINSQLTGTRNITSAYRTTGLGSINSDHIMGRAIDLTGQNLGQYARLTHENGGFAEFHGVGAARHLHAVPGPGAMGDTAVPSFGKMPQLMPAQGGSGSMNNITVNGAPGQSPEAIAAAVMQKIREHERTSRERS